MDYDNGCVIQDIADYSIGLLLLLLSNILDNTFIVIIHSLKACQDVKKL